MPYLGCNDYYSIPMLLLSERVHHLFRCVTPLEGKHAVETWFMAANRPNIASEPESANARFVILQFRRSLILLTLTPSSQINGPRGR